MSTFRPSRRSTVRITATALACAGTLVAGAAAASANPYDTNGDGYAEQYQYDANYDGLVDQWWTDFDRNGRIDSAIFDRDYNTVPDYWVADQDNDGYWDPALVDTNGDGYADSYAGSAPVTVSAASTAGAGCLSGQGYAAAVSVYGDCAWLQTASTNSGLGPSFGDVLADIDF